MTIEFEPLEWVDTDDPQGPATTADPKLNAATLNAREQELAVIVTQVNALTEDAGDTELALAGKASASALTALAQTVDELPFPEGSVDQAGAAPGSLLTVTALDGTSAQYGHALMPIDVNLLGATGDGSTDDTTALQAIIDTYAGQELRLRPGGVYCVSQLLLPDNTYLNLTTATIQRINNTAGSSGNATVRNADHVDGNSNITVRGGTISAASGTSGRPWVMMGVSNLRVQDVQIEKGESSFADWMFHFERCNTVRVDNCRVSGGTLVGEDGLHIKSTQDMTVSNCIFRSGDDAIALVHEFGQTNPIRDIAISNCVLSSAAANALRISVWSGETQPIENVTLSNIVIAPSPGGTCVIIDDQTNTGLIRRINLANFQVDGTAYTGTVNITNVVDSSFANWRVKPGNLGRAYALGHLERVTFSNCHADAPLDGAANNPSWRLDGGSKNVTFQGCSARSSVLWAFQVGGVDTSDITFVGCSSLGATVEAFDLSHVSRISLIGCTVTGGKAAIDCNTTNPPSDLRVIGCQFTGYWNTAVQNPVATMTYLGNVDQDGNVDRFGSSKLGFYGATPIAKPTGTPADAVDPATTQQLVNDLRAKLITLGLVA